MMRLVLIGIASLLVMAVLCYVGRAGAAFDPAPGRAPIALAPDMDPYAVPAKVRRQADYAVHGEVMEECTDRDADRFFMITMASIAVLLAVSVASVLVAADRRRLRRDPRRRS
ncbi:MAG: hypothetical protein OSA97_06790 [Nevskia sp.]|nr:hypothetical protein [Nevskia sp.]